MHVQKEAGILERGMQALKQAITSLLGQCEEDKPEHQVRSTAACFSSVRMSSSSEGSTDGLVDSLAMLSSAQQQQQLLFLRCVARVWQ